MAYAGFDHHLREVHRFFFAFHERAGANFDVEHKSVDAFREVSCS